MSVYAVSSLRFLLKNWILVIWCSTLVYFIWEIRNWVFLHFTLHLCSLIRRRKDANCYLASTLLSTGPDISTKLWLWTYTSQIWRYPEVKGQHRRKCHFKLSLPCDIQTRFLWFSACYSDSYNKRIEGSLSTCSSMKSLMSCTTTAPPVTDHEPGLLAVDLVKMQTLCSQLLAD